MAHPIQVEGLVKSYGERAALKGIDFEVRAGESFGLLGADGAGKTTTVEILAGLQPRSGGRVTVLECDPGADSRRVKDRVGVCLQAANLQEKLKVREALELFAGLYRRTVDRGQLLKRLRLWDRRDAPYSRLSGGERQRLAMALALLNDPQVVLLDEPSADLEPAARGEIHELIEDLRRERRTILLTTGSIGEAGKLCGRVAILDQGRIVAMGTPGELQERATPDSAIEMECASPLAAGALPQWVGAEKTEVDAGRTRVTVTSSRPARTMVEMMKWAEEQGIELAEIRLRRPSLEDAYRELTGKSPRE